MVLHGVCDQVAASSGPLAMHASHYSESNPRCHSLSAIPNATNVLLITRIGTLENKPAPVGGMGSIF